MHGHIYMEKLDSEIESLIKEESMSKSPEVDYRRQKELHLLFENRKHLKEYMHDKHSKPDKYDYSQGEHHDVMQDEKHKSSYFGG